MFFSSMRDRPGAQRLRSCHGGTSGRAAQSPGVPGGFCAAGRGAGAGHSRAWRRGPHRCRGESHSRAGRASRRCGTGRRRAHRGPRPRRLGAQPAADYTERTLPKMRYGDLLVGSLHNQTGYHRPFTGAGHHRTPVRGLYLCGASTHPGGNVTGLFGYNGDSSINTGFLGRPFTMQRPHYFVPSFLLGFSDHVQSDALDDVRLGADAVNRLLHFAMTTVSPFHGI